MIDKLKNYVEEMFKDAPKSKKTQELKEELKANLIDKYNDLKASGESDENSYSIAISGIGDIEEIVQNLKEDNVFDNKAELAQRKKSALLVSIAVGLFILSVVPVILISELSMMNEAIGIAIMFLMIAAGVILIVYNGMSKVNYTAKDSTMVEEFKEWKSSKNKVNIIKKTTISSFWSLIVVLYFAISFIFNAWAYSWIIFLIGGAFTQIIKAYFELKE